MLALTARLVPVASEAVGHHHEILIAPLKKVLADHLVTVNVLVLAYNLEFVLRNDTHHPSYRTNQVLSHYHPLPREEE